MHSNLEPSFSMDNNTQIPQRRRTPSFSSSLLDAIYRSIDESNSGNGGGGNGEEEVLASLYQETSLIKKQNSDQSVHSVSANALLAEQEKDLSSLRRAILIESWIEKQSNATSTSSESSSGGGGRRRGSVFSSSSETESSIPESSRISKQDSDEKKQKQKKPISPGGRIAHFLNSIFTSGNGKKVKMCSIGAMDDVTSTTTSERKSKSTCSSVTSFSRSCLSKTPPSRPKSSNKSKRSVRFYPVSVIVDEDSRPCGHKCIYEDDPGLMPNPVVKKFAKNYSFKRDSGKGSAKYNNNRNHHHQKKNIISDLKGFHNYESDEEEEDDDNLSCSSSDLFELDHIMGIGRYREELPVYETTSFKKNQAIANGFIL
ncbi:protein BIG GRAIN 1-like C [Mercurialis annua]|uniref:protein BIG GRAIN 1-like C n=1 Tax=Mercurialis annua TaxID=3986 RepID=UPI00215E8734|nr:protein BIG GRAIN 1-like C [Mercurialis annua]